MKSHKYLILHNNKFLIEQLTDSSVVMVFKRRVSSVIVDLLQSVPVILAVTQTVHSHLAPCAG